MKYKEIFSRITGFSVPLFGVSWNPKQPEVAIARKVLVFFEDRRVLYNPFHMEMEEHCLQSVVEIRRFLTEIIGQLDSSWYCQVMEPAFLSLPLTGRYVLCCRLCLPLQPKKVYVSDPFFPLRGQLFALPAIT